MRARSSRGDGRLSLDEYLQIKDSYDFLNSNINQEPVSISTKSPDANDASKLLGLLVLVGLVTTVIVISVSINSGSDQSEAYVDPPSPTATTRPTVSPTPTPDISIGPYGITINNFYKAGPCIELFTGIQSSLTGVSNDAETVEEYVAILGYFNKMLTDTGDRAEMAECDDLFRDLFDSYDTEIFRFVRQCSLADKDENFMKDCQNQIEIINVRTDKFLQRIDDVNDWRNDYCRSHRCQ